MSPDLMLERHPAEWRAATRHAFLDGVREGSLPEAAFRAWLVLDHHFVDDLLRFQARLLAAAPRADQAVLVGGLAALEAELGWFEAHAEHLGLDLAAPAHPTAVEYREWLESLAGAPYESGLTALWTLELAYLEAWRSAAPGAPAFREFVEHWTVPEFAGYVDGLRVAVERAGGEVAAFLETARLEAAFWEMTWRG